MDDFSIIDNFLTTFSNLIDSGFGLLGPDVRYLTSTLIAIDITLAGLFWAAGGGGNATSTILKKVLYVGFFAFIISNFAFLSGVIFDSFAQLGVTAGAGGFTAEDLMRPGFVAATGFNAGKPILVEMGELVGPVGIFVHAVTLTILGVTYFVIIFSFFILAVQLFITVLEFKLTTLAGFVLIPFALWNKTTFLAERVLGNVITSGIKLMLLSIILAIGSTVFADLSSSLAGGDIKVVQALSTLLGAISIFGLGIFGPSIASGLISGAPQLGAGAAAGAVAGLVAGGAIAGGAARAAGGGASSAIKAGSSLAGGASTAFSLGKATSGTSGASGIAAGAAGVARAGGDALKTVAAKPLNAANDAFNKGSAAAFQVTGGSSSGGTIGNSSTGGAGSGANDNWARRFEHKQNMRHAAGAAASTMRSGDGSSSGANPSLNQREDQT